MSLAMSTVRAATGTILTTALLLGAGVDPGFAHVATSGGPSTTARAGGCTALGEGCPVAAVFLLEAATGKRDWPNLTQGARGNRVRAVQLMLNDRGAGLAVDGRFGPLTANAVSTFQARQGLRLTGKMSDRTFERLLLLVSYGDRGREVRAVQRLLRSSGHLIEVDGIFGPRTRTAVLARQGETGRVTDGVVGPKTWFV